MIRTLVQLLLLTLLLAVASCKRSDVGGNQNGGGGNVSGAGAQTSLTPPFATREPERYQAVRVISSSVGAEATDSGAESSQTFIARDGEKRREEYEVAGEKFARLELGGGTYLLLPAKKLYAELKPEAGDAGVEPLIGTVPDFSPDKLLNETRPESQYERLGTETINGRATVKYRVTLKGRTGAAKEVATESIVWVDESLGMPVKTETTSAGARVSMELRDIKETVDAHLFELPADYRKVEARELFAQAK